MILSLSSSAQLARILLGRGLYVPADKSDMIAAVQALGLTDAQILAESYTDPVDPPVLILPALTPDAAPARIEQGQIDTLFKRLHREVADQFSAFRAVTSPEVVAQIAATLPPGAATAGSIFGVETCQYPGVDFSGLVVSVWNDPAAPVVVSDYVFSPENLHQALIAMDDPLPDNVWPGKEAQEKRNSSVRSLPDWGGSCSKLILTKRLKERILLAAIRSLTGRWSGSPALSLRRYSIPVP